MIDMLTIMLFCMGIAIIAFACVYATLRIYKKFKLQQELTEVASARAKAGMTESMMYREIFKLLLQMMDDLAGDYIDTAKTQMNLIRLANTMDAIRYDKTVYKLYRDIKHVRKVDPLNAVDAVKELLTKYYSYDPDSKIMSDSVVKVCDKLHQAIIDSYNQLDRTINIALSGLCSENIQVRFTQIKDPDLLDEEEEHDTTYYLKQMLELNRKIDRLVEAKVIVVPKEEQTVVVTHNDVDNMTVKEEQTEIAETVEETTETNTASTKVESEEVSTNEH